MNRANRRKQERIDQRKAKNSPMEVDIKSLPIEDKSISSGDIFTVQGLRKTRYGKWINNCKPGDETPFRAK